ncbi:hypothetical protein AVEN_191296-1 [Araneus ventricosus]|uniref:Uncharacterized protein n=1 Tax=Araneus ventricosus TaxID=182803 RepID=A0A4Y2HA32_ARAVE|nr:hypothetical protein AVEN_191296-1 [Araneus ventricosus]
MGASDEVRNCQRLFDWPIPTTEATQWPVLSYFSGTGFTRNAERCTKFHLSKSFLLEDLVFRSMRLYRPTDSQPFDGLGPKFDKDLHPDNKTVCQISSI